MATVADQPRPGVLIDTNVFVYAHDRRDKDKQTRAVEVVESLAAFGAAVVSTQVLAECYTAVTSRIPDHLSPREAQELIEGLILAARPVNVTPFVVREAISGAVRLQLHYWDAQLWATAKLNGIDTILTEDFEDGRVLEGVRFVDPFAEGFSMAQLGLPG